jgi:hypothetical protein
MHREFLPLRIFKGLRKEGRDLLIPEAATDSTSLMASQTKKLLEAEPL